MYQNNIYIDNYEELKAITKPNGDKADMGVQYKHWRAVETGVDKLLSRADKKLLGL